MRQSTINIFFRFGIIHYNESPILDVFRDFCSGNIKNPESADLKTHAVRTLLCEREAKDSTSST